MLTIPVLNTQKNPFKVLLSTLIDNEYQEVSLPFLAMVSGIINNPTTIVETYGEAFRVLEFLAEAKVVELVPIAPELNQFKIRKLYNGD